MSNYAPKPRGVWSYWQLIQSFGRDAADYMTGERALWIDLCASRKERVQLTADQFNRLCICLVDAVASVEGWDDVHPSWDKNLEPSRQLKAEIRRRLPRDFRVLPKAKDSELKVL